MGWLGDTIEAWRARRRLAREIDPRAIQRMAREIRDLAMLAAHLGPRGKDVRALIRNILAEMDRLTELTDRPEFRRLSPGKRLLLRQGLLESREQLLESIESTPSPTERIQ
ncbi:hypothetical protein [Pseudodesulfovibrio pelocollis]|uniref:hypothetical protein n=1 Tax=Pseudodesulfovibrio pelocollis TaxID=3051432 RepID=UPI00255AD112|nr:hypothetical protein [Pseudodesulfovibrio sp. SB368]